MEKGPIIPLGQEQIATSRRAVGKKRVSFVPGYRLFRVPTRGFVKNHFSWRGTRAALRANLFTGNETRYCTWYTGRSRQPVGQPLIWTGRVLGWTFVYVIRIATRFNE